MLGLKVETNVINLEFSYEITMCWLKCPLASPHNFQKEMNRDNNGILYLSIDELRM